MKGEKIMKNWQLESISGSNAVCFCDPDMNEDDVDEFLGKAHDALSKAWDMLDMSAGKAEGFPLEARIESIRNAVSDLDLEISKIRKELGVIK